MRIPTPTGGNPKIPPDLDNLLSEVTQRLATGQCWATQLTGDAVEFVRRVQEKQKTTTINCNAVARVLEREFGVKLTSESVRNHLRGKCRCGRP